MPERAASPLQHAARRLLRRLRGAPAHELLIRGDGVADGSRDWPSFGAWCQAHPRQRCRLWLASALLHELVCDPALPLSDDAAALAWARPLLQHYHGDAALGWPLAAWQAGSRGVSALHGASLAALQADAGAAGVRLLAVQPWWSRRLRQAVRQHTALRAPQALLLLLEGRRLAVLGLARGQLTRLELRQLDGSGAGGLPAGLADAALPTLLVDEGSAAAATGLSQRSQPLQARWLGAQAAQSPAARSPQRLAGFGTARSTPGPDFLRPVRGPHRLAWAACATAFAVLAVAALDAHDAWQALAAPPAPVAARVAGAASAPPARSAAASRAEAEAGRRVQAAVASLQRPWPDAFAALEAVDAAGIAWLALDLGEGGRLRLQGQAASTGTALAAADALRRTGPWRDVLLGSMDAVAAPAGGAAALRFEISAGALQ